MVQQHEQLNAADFYIGPNVEIKPGVVIAAGAVLDAAPGSRLILETGVCIGSGVVIQVYGGDLTLASGVSLGKEVLLVGTGIVGTRACIGAESTLINPQVEADAVVPARSLVGPGVSTSLPAESNGHSSSASGTNGHHPPASANGHANGVGSEDQVDPEEQGDSTLAPANIVYGREQVMQLMKTLFPHRDLLNGQ